MLAICLKLFCRFNLYSLLLIYCSFSVTGQTKEQINQLYQSYDKHYGLDPRLYNGVKYVPEHPFALGMPFWASSEPFQGELVIQGIKYSNLHLQYDNFRQEFILHFYDLNNAQNALIVNSNLIDTVFLGQTIFVHNKIKEIDEPFIQLIYTGKLSCYIAWNKEYSFISGGPHPGFQYSKDYKKIYIQPSPDTIKLVKQRKDFFKLFDPSELKEIKAYFHQHKIKFKSIDDNSLTLLLAYCNTVLLK
jgi:hypothetical protein